MSKSAGNFYTLRDLMEQGWSGREVRYALLSVHYRAPLNFTFEGLAAARSALLRLDEWGERLQNLARTATGESPLADLPLDAFGEALDDDLNISAALAAVFEMIRETHRRMDQNSLTPNDARALCRWLEGVQSVLGLEPEAMTVPDAIQTLLQNRAEARAAKNFAESDRLRDAIQALGWLVKDTKEGQKLSKG